MVLLHAKSIAIVGAGPSGLVAAKYLLAEKAFEKIVIFEQRSRSGGIWNYTPETEEDLFTIPQTDPRGKVQDPLWKGVNGFVNGDVNVRLTGPTNGHSASGATEASFLSPIYDRLETNIPRGLMGFRDLDWPADSQLFPKHETVLDYIHEYGRDVQHLVRCETQVIKATPTSQSANSKWSVTARNLRTNDKSEDIYDALIVANGHFITPYIPDITGIKTFSIKHPGSISHSKYFRRPEDFAGRKVVVVGNSASGLDISTQISAVSAHPLLWSSKSASMFGPAPNSAKLELPPIVEFLPETRGVRFENDHVEKDIDAIVFATGYFYSLPFLHNVRPVLIGDGNRVQHTYQHLFFAPQPTLSFLALPQRVTPFSIAEAQSAVIARVYSGRPQLPSYTDMQKWEESVIADRGNGKNFHLLPFPADGNYINALSSWALSAQHQGELEEDGKGKLPPVWGQWEFWCRENFPAIKRAFGECGEERHGVRSLEDLGFSFEEHLARKKSEEGKMI